jgi:signal transduction histidine kinase
VAGAQPAATARGLAIEARVAPGLAPLGVDRERMGQVLTNLLDNAVRHARNVIVVAAEKATDGGLRISVRDDGDGIPAESLPHVFERFYRLDSARDRESGGSGIGLAIAKALVGAHGGRITAESSGPGCGATFTIILPGAAPKP